MPSTEPPLPLLKPADWNERDVMVCRPLADLPAQGMPLVAYGWDHPNTFELLSRDHAGGATPDSLDRGALAGLRARSATWQPIEIKLGWFKKVRFLVCGDDFLAAERILDEQFLQQAQRTLGAKLLAVGIPRRGMLMACDGAASKDHLQRFCAAVAGQFHRAETPPITATVFGVIDGKIVGHLEDGGIASEVKTRVADEPAEDIYIQSISLDDAGTRRTVICAGGMPLDRLEARIRRELSSLVAKYGAALRAEVAIIPDLTPKTTALDAWLPTLAAGLTGLAGELGAAHAVEVNYGQPGE